MHTESVERWVHAHTFGQDEKKSAERRTLIVSVVTILTMIVEIGAGIAFGSMALLADGLHMGSHFHQWSSDSTRRSSLRHSA